MNRIKTAQRENIPNILTKLALDFKYQKIFV